MCCSAGASADSERGLRCFSRVSGGRPARRMRSPTRPPGAAWATLSSWVCRDSRSTSQSALASVRWNTWSIRVSSLVIAARLACKADQVRTATVIRVNTRQNARVANTSRRPSEPAGRGRVTSLVGWPNTLQPLPGDGIVGAVAADGLQPLAEALDHGVLGLQAEGHVQAVVTAEVGQAQHGHHHCGRVLAGLADQVQGVQLDGDPQVDPAELEFFVVVLVLVVRLQVLADPEALGLQVLLAGIVLDRGDLVLARLVEGVEAYVALGPRVQVPVHWRDFADPLEQLLALGGAGDRVDQHVFRVLRDVVGAGPEHRLDARLLADFLEHGLHHLGTHASDVPVLGHV